MRPKIYRYQHNGNKYYAEGYNEVSIRVSLETYLQIPQGTLEEGQAPNFKTELKLIWDKKNKTHKLTLTKEQTTSREQLSVFKSKQHCLYELKLLLREDVDFLNGHQGHVIANEVNEVKFWNSKYIRRDGSEIGFEMCYSFQGSTDSIMTDKIYRFKNLAAAYQYVRSNIVKLNIGDEDYNSNFTNLEMCDSFIAGFGSADLTTHTNGDEVSIIEKSPPAKHNLVNFEIL